MIKALILYWSATGNTEKVAEAIERSLKREHIAVTRYKIVDFIKEDMLDFDLIFLGSPSYQFLPPEPVIQFVKRKMKYYQEQHEVKICAPKRSGKAAIVFCTYSGPHTGINEAIPVCKYLGQFFEHIGFELMGEWYIVGEFHGREEFSTEGRLGDIRGRPNQNDLYVIENNVETIVKKIRKLLK